MGLETICRVEFEGRASEGRAHCGDGELSFKGEFQLRWKWDELSRVAVDGEVLSVTRGSQTARFHLGERAAQWAHSINSPKPRLDKFGLKPNHRYAAWGEFDPDFAGELVERAGEPCAEDRLDVVFVQLIDIAELPKLREARAKIVSNGMVWAVWPKGRKEFREDDIRQFAIANGLVDVKVASFSQTLSALKLVIPVALRS